VTTKQTISSLSAINPLTDGNGDTAKVSAALDFAAWAIKAGGDEKGELTLTAGQAFGLTMILETCSAALKEMA